MFENIKLTKKETDALTSLGIIDFWSVFVYYPYRYDTVVQKPFSEWNIKDKVSFEGKIVSGIKTNRFKKITITKFEVETNDNIFEITLFNRPWFKGYEYGSFITIFGQYEGRQKVNAMQYNSIPLNEQLGYYPMYRLKDGITLKKYRKVVEAVFKDKFDDIDEMIPKGLKEKYRLLDRKVALRMIHFPKSEEEIKQSLRTLKYEEFLLFQLTVQMRKNALSQKQVGAGKFFDFDAVFRLANQLSFTLTNDQIKAVNEILSDLSEDKTMYRLVQGDVGSGKTLVAMLGLYGCVLAGKQGAFMVPTEILAKQHYASLKQFFKPTGLKIACLYSSLANYEKKQIIEDLKNNVIDIIVGTHSLIQDSVLFYDLGMVVTDEQHRFGVEQRKKLKNKGNKVDFLMMSATPIPRTLASIVYGDMDISTILTLPKGRKSIITKLINKNSMVDILDEVLDLVEKKNRCYIVCPMIEEDDSTSVKNVEKIHRELQKEIQEKRGKSFKIGLLHGKMTSVDKEAVMSKFASGEYDLLVTTTVIEVGVNVAEANVMVIYDANRFGMSQLHQLRGRVGRGNQQGYCFLLTNSEDHEALEKLKVIASTNDGFEIANFDLKFRGPGDVLGTKQSGIPHFTLANIIQDQAIMDTARKDAVELLADSSIAHSTIIQKAKKALLESDFID